MGHTCRSPSVSVKSLPPLLSVASRIRTLLNPASSSVFAAVTPEIPQPIIRIWQSAPAMLVSLSHWNTHTKFNATVPSNAHDASLINTFGLCNQRALAALCGTTTRVQVKCEVIDFGWKFHNPKPFHTLQTASAFFTEKRVP